MSEDYILGVNQKELARLEFQNGVWKKVTDDFIARCGVTNGMKCLDVGAGPGFVSMDLLNIIGAEGELTALEPSELYLNHFKDYCKEKSLTNVKFINSTVEESELPENYFDFIFARWVISFVPDPELFLSKIYKALKPGGIIALQDYNYEGITRYPQTDTFKDVPDAVRKYWLKGGGDPYIALRIPELFKKTGLKLTDYKPNVLAGNKDSDVFEWAHKFFSVHFDVMAKMGAISSREADEMLQDWLEHRYDSNAIFYSPIVVDMAGRK